ncbi:MAG: rod shape-determining protein MreD [Planctomycetaceae bacterium]
MLVNLCTLLAVYIAFVLQALGAGGNGAAIQPLWLSLCAAGILWTHRLAPAVLWAGLCGLLADTLSGLPAGREMLVLAVLVWAIGALRRNRRWQSLLALLLVIFCVAGGNALVAAMLRHGVLDLSAFDWHRNGLLAASQGAVTALWGGGLACLWRVTAATMGWLLPPIAWRRSRAA